MQKIYYIANIRLPTEKAHGLQIMKTCEAMARQGVEVELIVPKRFNHITEDPFVFYGVKKNFTITKLWCLDLISLNFFGSVGFWVESWTFYRSVRKYLKQQQSGVYYTRDLPIANWLSKSFGPLFYEIHTLPDVISSRYRSAWQRAKGLVVISNGLKSALLKQGIVESKILVARDAVDIEQFSIALSQIECRRKLELPQDKKIVLYSGHLYSWKGVYNVLAVAKLLPEVLFIFVGGTTEDLLSFRQRAKTEGTTNVLIFGYKKHEEIPPFLKAADVLLLPNSAMEKISEYYTSPLKLFEYMASGVPIVASDIPSIREVLSEKNAFFFPTDNLNKFVDTINFVLNNPAFSGKIAAQAHEDSKRFSWANRTKAIINFL